MEELLRTNDLVLISFAEALLSDAGIGHVVLDQHMSMVEGSLGVLPRRMLVEEGRADEARQLLRDADVDVPG